MVHANGHTRIAHCKCRKVSIGVDDNPIISVAWYCNSCLQAGQQLEKRPKAPPIIDADGGTHFMLYRKDRVSCLKGHDFLREHRLTSKSATRRVVATCCNSAMFLEFSSGHWLSLYTNRFDEKDQIPFEKRTMTIDRKPRIEFADDIPSPNKHSARFMWKLLAAWIAMGFRTPKIDYVKGELDG